MAGPSSLSTNDSLLALRLQLVEAGAGHVSVSALLDLPQHAPPQASLQHDLSLACELTCQDLSLHHDSLLAQSVASKTPSSSDVMLTNPAIPPLSCPICLELCPAAARFVTPCKHAFCITCIRKHLTLVATETKKFPITCPSCRTELDPSQCLSVLVGTQAYRDLEKLVMEKMYHGRLRYCANEDCAAPFDWDDDERFRKYTDRYRVKCPLCKCATCVKCRVLWHDGQSCERFQEEREGRDLLVRLARREQWMACPDCGHIIERRRGDCNFVRCRCGCGFCHKCGTKYLSLEVTRANTHGRPGCGCGLFDNGEEVAQEDDGDEEEEEEIVDVDEEEDEEEDEEMNNNVEQVLEPPPILRNPLLGAHLRELRDLHEQRQRNRQEFEEIVQGPNGFLALRSWLRGVGIRRKRLPAAMEEDVRRYICPYRECGEQFVHLRALQQHLVNVRRHDVFLCCGRPFATVEGLERHAEAVH